MLAPLGVLAAILQVVLMLLIALIYGILPVCLNYKSESGYQYLLKG